MILPIYLYGQPVLRKQAEEIEQTPELKQFIADMYETLTQAEGCGLAAPQVGVLRRVVLVLETNVPEGEEPYIIELINRKSRKCIGFTEYHTTAVQVISHNSLSI